MPSKRHIRWVETLRNFNYVLGYRPGKQNSVADTLSRREDLKTEEEERPVFEPFSAEKMIPVDDLEANEVSIEELEEMALALLTTDGNIQEDIREWIRQKGTTVTQKTGSHLGKFFL